MKSVCREEHPEERQRVAEVDGCLHEPVMRHGLEGLGEVKQRLRLIVPSIGGSLGFQGFDPRSTLDELLLIPKLFGAPAAE